MQLSLDELGTYTCGMGNEVQNIKEGVYMQTNKQKKLTNFKKAHSHLAKIIKMVEDDEYCIDIMQQNLAVIGLLKSVHRMLMEGHLNTCFKKAMESKNEKKKQEMISEILQVINLFNR